MKRLNLLRAKAGGYTIVETLIVLGVSALLVLGVITLISGQQGKTEFTQGIRDADVRIQDVMNDFATGYYNQGEGLSCSAGPGASDPPVLSKAPINNDLGTNISCVYVGRLIHLITDDNYTVHTIVGRQYSTVVLSPEVGDLVSARPRLIAPATGDDPTNTTFPNTSETAQFSGNISFKRMEHYNSGSPVAITAFGVVSSFGKPSGGLLSTDKQTPQLIAITGSAATSTELADKFVGFNSSSYVADPTIAICFESTSSNQYGIVRIGGNQGKLSTNTVIGSGTCPASIF